jgi:antitoxin (DNA-binding transcriptional repressor) of toxin-antitoxin stability system
MKALTIHQTKTQLSALLRDVDKGKTVTFGDRGAAQYQITKLPAKKVDRSKAFGIWKGKVWVAPDAFSPETDVEIWKDFWDEDIADPNKESNRKND